ncbi:hypothetical protein ABEB36_014229 [Hypothenemus hampei]|uniref:snRNA-activating protein complex subunit 3 n=1 Tax=Hypothenemus hampei TaxID=57062 RepID=A0ABD1E3P7_HYPHA
MEKIYNPEDFSASEPLNASDYFKRYQEVCRIEPTHYENPLKLLNEEFGLSLNEEDVQKLADIASVTKLKVPNENPNLPIRHPPKDLLKETHPITEDALKLNTIMKLNQYGLLKEPSHTRKPTIPESNYKNKQVSNITQEIIPGQGFLYNILVYKPFDVLKNNTSSNNMRTMLSVEVLYKNTLWDFAETIKCVSDEFHFKEVQDMEVDLLSLQNSKEKYPSRCFFIENVFYVDMSHPNAIDYSDVIRKWAIEKQIGDFHVKPMQETTFDELRPRLGYSYVYIHQGDCEHVFTFSDAKLISYSDCMKPHPNVLHCLSFTNYCCYMCNLNCGNWMVSNSDRLPVRKAFFCTECCESFMFSDGKKVGTFQLIPFCLNVENTAQPLSIDEYDEE